MPRSSVTKRTLAAGDIIDAYDPGVTTGYCRLQYLGGRDYVVVASREILWENRHADVREISTYMPDHVVVESFRLYSGAAKHMINDTFPACEMIGIITHAMWIISGPTVLAQQAAEIKDKITVLPEHEAQIGRSPHRRDAYCHGRLFILVHRLGG